MPPKSAAADVVPINIRMPKRLHKRLEQEARKPGNSITAEVIARLERSFDLERLPSSEQLANALLAVARRYPAVMENEKVKEFVENLEEAVFQPEAMDEIFGTKRK
jgi:hypothetical protein